jgi:tetratricopeptide (TPR) repeat protein
MGRFKEAEAEYRTALRLDELDPLKWQDLGNVLLDMARYRDALRAFRRAAHLEPTAVRAHSGMAHALDLLGRGDEALAAYDKALSLDSDDPSIWNNRAVLLAETLNRIDEALDAYEQALQVAPDYYLARFNRAQLLVKLERMGEAKADLRQVYEVIERDGQDAIPELHPEDIAWMRGYLAAEEHA